jgi:hypothetical protein
VGGLWVKGGGHFDEFWVEQAGLIVGQVTPNIGVPWQELRGGAYHAMVLSEMVTLKVAQLRQKGEAASDQLPPR